MRLLALVVLLSLPAGSSFAQGHFVLPRIGVGGGVGGRTFSDPLLQLDLVLGGEWRRPAGDAMGFDLRFDVAGSLGRPTGAGWATFQAGVDVTFSTGYDDGLPFAGLAAGPLFAFTNDSDLGLSTGGVGLHLEGTIGFKSYVELYASFSTTIDRAGLFPMLVGGLRLHTDLFWVLFFRPVIIVTPAAPPAVHGAAPVDTHGAAPIRR